MPQEIASPGSGNRLIWLVVVLTFLFPGVKGVAAEEGALEMAVRAYYSCVKSGSEKYARTPERPADIITAVMGQCRGHLTEAARLSGGDGDKFTAILEENARERGMGTIMAARYPDKGEGSLQPVGHAPEARLLAAFGLWKLYQSSGGLSTVRTESRACFDLAARTRSWEEGDICVAMDKFALVLDRSINAETPGSRDPYFADETVIARWNRLVEQMPGARSAKVQRVTNLSNRAEALLNDKGPL